MVNLNYPWSQTLFWSQIGMGLLLAKSTATLMITAIGIWNQSRLRTILNLHNFVVLSSKFPNVTRKLLGDAGAHAQMKMLIAWITAATTNIEMWTLD